MKININILSLLSGNETHFDAPPQPRSLEASFSYLLIPRACCPGKACPALSIHLPETLPGSDESNRGRLPSPLMPNQSRFFDSFPTTRGIFCECGVEILGCLRGRFHRSFKKNVFWFNTVAVEIGVVVCILFEDGSI
jgi:hypothetical protein